MARIVSSDFKGAQSGERINSLALAWVLMEKSLDCRNERWEIVLEGIPNHVQIYIKVGVHEPVAHRDNVFPWKGKDLFLNIRRKAETPLRLQFRCPLPAPESIAGPNPGPLDFGR